MAKKRPARLSAGESKRLILEATLKLLPKHGWSRTSFQMIADDCDISQSTVLYHYKTRETLLEALLEKISANNFRIVSEAMKPEHNAFERILIHCEKNLEWGIRFPQEAQVIILVYYEATHDNQFAKLFRQILDRAQARMLEYVLAGLREEIFHPTVSPHILSKVLHNVLVGKFINLMSGRKTNVTNYDKSDWEQIVSDLTGFNKR